MHVSCSMALKGGAPKDCIRFLEGHSDIMFCVVSPDYAKTNFLRKKCHMTGCYHKHCPPPPLSSLPFTLLSLVNMAAVSSADCMQYILNYMRFILALMRSLTGASKSSNLDLLKVIFVFCYRSSAWQDATM